MTLAEEALLFLDTGEISEVTTELLDEIFLQEQIEEAELSLAIDPEFDGYSTTS